MAERSDARKRHELERAAAVVERRREVLQQALAAVWSGADFTDADAVLDQLGDLGASVVLR